MRVYIVTANDKISAEAYADFEQAKRFILGRSDKPKMVAPWKFVSGENTYEIHDVLVRMKKD